MLSQHIIQKNEEIKEDSYEITIKQYDISITTQSSLLENKDPLVIQLREMIIECKYLYYDHKLEKAYEIFKKIEFLIKNEKTTSSSLILKAIYEQDEKLWFDISREYTYMKQVTKELMNDDEWITEKSSDGVTIKYKYIPRTDLVTIKTEGVVDCPLANLLTLIYENELYTKWVPFLTVAEQLKVIHRASKVAYMKLALPYPLADRDVCLAGMGVDLLDENGSILVLAGSIDDDLKFLENHSIEFAELNNPKNVKVSVKFCGFEIKPISSTKCLLRGVTNINPKIGFLPTSVINWFLRKASGLLFSRIADKAKNIKGTVWEENMKKVEKREFYEWLERRLNEYFKKQGI